MIVSLNLDGSAQARAAAALPAVQAAYASYLTAHPELSPFTPDINYVYTTAVTVGLSFWRAPNLWAPSYPFGNPGDVPTVATFNATSGTSTSTIPASVAASDVSRANAIIAALGGTPTLVNVLGCACCTGLAVLSGTPVLQGPFQ
jgi:hypothetical protein